MSRNKRSEVYHEKSKYSYLDEEKLDDNYLTNFLRELWSVPSDKVNEFIQRYYPNPTALEYVEIQHLVRLMDKMSAKDNSGKFTPLSRDEFNMLKYRHDRMYGKEKSVVELSGQGGGPISIKEMSDEELETSVKEKLSNIAEAIRLANKK